MDFQCAITLYPPVRVHLHWTRENFFMIFAAVQFQQFIDFPDSSPSSDTFFSPCKMKL